MLWPGGAPVVDLDRPQGSTPFLFADRGPLCHLPRRVPWQRSDRDRIL